MRMRRLKRMNNTYHCIMFFVESNAIVGFSRRNKQITGIEENIGYFKDTYWTVVPFVYKSPEKREHQFFQL